MEPESSFLLSAIGSFLNLLTSCIRCINFCSAVLGHHPLSWFRRYTYPVNYTASFPRIQHYSVTAVNFRSSTVIFWILNLLQLTDPRPIYLQVLEIQKWKFFMITSRNRYSFVTYLWLYLTRSHFLGLFFFQLQCHFNKRLNLPVSFWAHKWNFGFIPFTEWARDLHLCRGNKDRNANWWNVTHCYC
jgi:hypothetical protein